MSSDAAKSGQPSGGAAGPVVVRLLGRADLPLLDNVAGDVFDHGVRASLAREFLEDPRHHLAVAIAEGVIVGFASALHYVHPDKPAELWINEVGVAPSHQGRGLGKRILAVLLEHGRALGCVQAWVLTDRSNTAAQRLYSSAGGVEAKGDTVMFEFRLGHEDTNA